jgi:hypothetical protein
MSVSIDVEALLAASLSGALANEDAILQVRESRVESSGMRAVDITPFGGIATRLLPDRGLDLGSAWFNGVPLAWVSATGETAPLDDLDGMAWGRAFGGGLLVTCGLRNVGAPSEGHGLHGTFAHLPAQNVVVTRSLDDAVVVITGLIVDDRQEPMLEVHRRITVAAATGRIELEDVATNLGSEPEGVPLLYHVNFGFPLWSGAATLELTRVSTAARDEASEDMLNAWETPPPVSVGPERVLEHTIENGEPGWARVSNKDLGIGVTLRWDSGALPIVNQWLDPNPGMAVLGVEPSNCRTRGRAYDRAQGVLPMLDPGEARTTGLTIEAATLD